MCCFLLFFFQCITHISLLRKDPVLVIWIIKANFKCDKDKLKKYCLLLIKTAERKNRKMDQIQSCVCLRVIGRWREKHFVCPAGQKTSAILSASVDLWASHRCDVPNCCWQETDHVKNNCISTVVSYICYTTLLSVNCGYDTCRESGVVLAAVAREQLGRSAAADGTVTFPAGDPEHLNSEGRGKFSFTRDQTAYRLQPPQLATDLGGTPSLWLSRQILKTVPFVGTGLLFLALPVCGCVNKNCHGLIHLSV